MIDTNYREFKLLFEELWNMGDEESDMKRSSIFTRDEMSLVQDEWNRYRVAVTSTSPTDNDYNPKYRMSVAMQFWRTRLVTFLLLPSLRGTVSSLWHHRLRLKGYFLHSRMDCRLFN